MHHSDTIFFGHDSAGLLPDVIQNLYVSLTSVKHKIRYYEEQWGRNNTKTCWL